MSIRKLISFLVVALLLISLTSIAFAADEVRLVAKDAKIAEGDFLNGDGQTLVNTELPGFFIEWENVPASTHVRLAYDTQNGGTMSLYVNGEFAVKLPIPDTGSWWSAFPESEPVKVNIPEGATIRIQVDEGDANANFRDVILTKGVAVEDSAGDNPKTGDVSAVMYIAMAVVAGGALLSRKKFIK